MLAEVPSVGDKYYFDDYLKSNVPPAVENTYSPLNGATDVSEFATPTITSNFQFRNLDDSSITDVSSYVELRKNDASGELVAITAALSADNSSITINPSDILAINTTYWYGIKDDVIEYKETNTAVTGLSATFTTVATAISMVTYNDFDGNSLTTVSESMGDPAEHMKQLQILKMEQIWFLNGKKETLGVAGKEYIFN